jgi:hypothetical protein
MRVTTNTRMIRRRAKFGTYASLGGIAVLAGGMVASFQPQLVWVSLVALIAGFLLAQYGNYNLRRYGRSPRPDEIVADSLKGFDDRYHLYAWSLPAPFVLLTPHGLYSFVTRDQNGEITNNGSQWKTKFSLGRALLMFSQEGLGNPTQDAQQYAAKLTEWVRGKLPEITITAQPAIIFTDPRAQLHLTDPGVPVLDTKGVKKWLRSGKPELIKNAELRQLEALFDEFAALAQTGGK